jgi:predicted acyltransferase
MPTTTPQPTAIQRLLSLDFMRGMIMVLLALESCGLWEQFSIGTEGGWLHPLAEQFSHHPWHGLHFWDLVQPAFMFMAGTAMAFSLHKQRLNGMTWRQSFIKTLKRCGWLFFWGVLNYAVRPNGLSFELWDVLTQLSFTTLVAFLIFEWSATAQIIVCIALLLITEALYRFTHVPGFDQPFTDQHNFGNYVDLLLMNKINKGGWVAINCIPTAVHTIGGALAGKLLMGNPTRTTAPPAHAGPVSTHPRNKPLTLLVWGLIALALGYTLDLAGITPIIKRIATTSFTLASLGWVLWALAICYWWIDIRNHRNRLRFFTVVGMNSLFIYLFFEIVGDRWFNGWAGAITNGLMQPADIPVLARGIITALAIFTFEWSLCYFLFRKKIFFRL